jgi:hypothetical protein
MILATILALTLLQDPAAPLPKAAPAQRPAEITISVDEYARLKACETRELEAKAAAKKKAGLTAIHPLQLLIVATAIVGIVAIGKRGKKTTTTTTTTTTIKTQ